MRPQELEALLVAVRDGVLDVDEAVLRLRRVPVEDDLGFARVDTHRELRQGFPEAIYAEGKSTEQVVAIAHSMLDNTSAPVLATRVHADTAAALLDAFPGAIHHPTARLVVLRSEHTDAISGPVAVVCAGTSDLPVAEEAACTAEALGVKVERVRDVGVAGIHRILRAQETLLTAEVVIVVAGMEGALASIVGGIASAPVVAVPTSVGYGASFHGLAALLAMLNSCAAGVTVTNIDNGFGAALAAFRMLRRP